MAKANKDRWIRHRGGNCPVDGDTQVEVRFREKGQYGLMPAEQFRWNHTGLGGDILSYRIHTPQQQETEPMTAEQIRTKYIENLASIADLHTKNAALVDDLRKMGFDFYEATKEPQEDMSDPKNWRVGDVLECVSTRDMIDMTKGGLYKITETDKSFISMKDDVGDKAARIADSRFKFHSRPTK